MRRLFLLLLLTTTTCGDDDVKPAKPDAALVVFDAPPEPTVDAAVPVPDAAPVGCGPVSGTPILGLQEIAKNLSQPIVLTIPPGETRWFVAEKAGKIKIIENGVPRATAFLDISARTSKGSEQGLLGMAFHPGYAANGRFFVSYTDTSGDSRIWEYHVSADPNVAETQEYEILFVDQPAANHNGGQILFGPDGKLYLAFGDGGSQYDPSGNGQRLDTLLAKILRIDVDVERPQKYAVPADNPFVGMDNARGEIWHRGLRNPWRLSFDRETKDMWIGDVGQDNWEEIDLARAGQKGLNFGWGTAEGNNHCPSPPYEGTCAQAGAELPVFEYKHGVGSAVIGGPVYRGCKMPDLHGTYFFSDNSGGWIRSLRYAGSPVDNAAVTVYPLLAKSTPATWAEDQGGEPVFCSLQGGRCWRIVPN